jgi:hypothetical protein
MENGRFMSLYEYVVAPPPEGKVIERGLFNRS